MWNVIFQMFVLAGACSQGSYLSGYSARARWPSTFYNCNINMLKMGLEAMLLSSKRIWRGQISSKTSSSYATPKKVAENDINLSSRSHKNDAAKTAFSCQASRNLFIHQGSYLKALKLVLKLNSSHNGKRCRCLMCSDKCVFFPHLIEGARTAPGPSCEIWLGHWMNLYKSMGCDRRSSEVKIFITTHWHPTDLKEASRVLYWSFAICASPPPLISSQ